MRLKQVKLWRRAARRISVVMLVVLVTAGVVAQEEAAPAPIDVPQVDLDALSPHARALLGGAIDYFERESPALRGAELGSAYGRLGIHYQAHRQIDAATACFGNAMALDPGNFRWPYFLGLARQFGGDRHNAIGLFRRSLELNPTNPAGATRLGLALIERDEMEAAREILRKVVDHDVSSAAAHAGLGRVALARQDVPGAIHQFETALQLQPDADALHGFLARAYAQLGDAELSRVHAARQGQRGPQVKDRLVALLQAHMQGSEYYVNAGRQALQASQFAQAALFAGYAMAVNPADESAVVLLAEVRAASAGPAAQSVSEPVTADDFFVRGRAFERGGDVVAAMTDYRRAIELDEGLVGARVYLANTLMRERDFSGAAVQYGMASSRDGSNAELRYRQGLAWIGANRCDRAEISLLAGVEIDPTAARILQAIARVYATCSVDDKKVAQAVKWAELLYNARPNLETSATFAMVLAAAGRYAEAADLQRQAIFEALKAGTASNDDELSRNLRRYIDEKPSLRAWPSDHPIFFPAPPG